MNKILQDLYPVSTNEYGQSVYKIRLGDLIPEEFWGMGIEAVRVGERVIRNPSQDEIVSASSDDSVIAFDETTVWIADGVQWVEGIFHHEDGYGFTIHGIVWTLYPIPQPTRPPIPEE